MAKIKVLMVGNSSTVKGGITSVINQMLNFNWKEDGIDMTFIPTYDGGSNVHKILYFFKSYVKIKHLLKRGKIDVVHLHMSYKGSFYRKYLIQKICVKRNIPTIIHLHGSEFKKWYDGANKKTKKKVKNLLLNSSKFIVLGEEWESIVKSIEPKTETLIIKNSVKIPEITNQNKLDSFQVLFLGVLIKRKGVEDLLKAIKVLLDTDRIDNINVVIAGEGIEEDNLKKLAKNYGIEHYVNFVGWSSGDKKEKLLKESQLFVLPSYNEGLPISILEALSYGLPIVSTNVGDIASAVKNNYNGVLVEPGDVDAIADAIYKIKSNKTLYDNMSKVSRTLAEKEFSDNTYCKRFSECYFELSTNDN